MKTIGYLAAVMSEKTALSHSMAHYLLAIHKLNEERGYARITDMAKELNLSKGSVSIAINNLKKRNLVTEDEGGKFPILTDFGHQEVHRILSGKTLLFYFLKDFVQVDEGTAAAESCQIEHLIGQQTNKKLFEFMRKLSCCDPQDFPEFSATIDLCKYKNMEEFVESQKGDSYLSE